MKQYLFLFLIFVLANSYAQTVTKVLISGQNTSHDTNVKDAFLLGYKNYNGTQYAGQIDLHTDYDAFSALRYAHQNGYQVVVRSYTGLNSTVNDSAKKYTDLLLFMPAGSNSFVYVCNLDIPNSAVVSTGAGSDTLKTGYTVEFFSIDPITSSNLSSFSNGYIAGQIAFLANYLNISLSQARADARNTAQIPTQSITFVEYGKIDISRAISALPVELVSFNVTIQKESVSLNWKTATEVNNYGFNVERNTPLNTFLGGETGGGGVWETVGFIQGHGNSNSPKTYSYVDTNPPGGIVKYRLKQIDFDGKFEYSEVVQVNIETPDKIELSQNHPNPFNPETTISFKIQAASYVTLKVHDILGREVATLVDEVKQPGVYNAQFPSNRGGLISNSQIPSGVYFYTLHAGNYISTKKMILMK